MKEAHRIRRECTVFVRQKEGTKRFFSLNMIPMRQSRYKKFQMEKKLKGRANFDEQQEFPSLKSQNASANFHTGYGNSSNRVSISIWHYSCTVAKTYEQRNL